MCVWYLKMKMRMHYRESRVLELKSIFAPNPNVLQCMSACLCFYICSSSSLSSPMKFNHGAACLGSGAELMCVQCDISSFFSQASCVTLHVSTEMRAISSAAAASSSSANSTCPICHYIEVALNYIKNIE